MTIKVEPLVDQVVDSEDNLPQQTSAEKLTNSTIEQDAANLRTEEQDDDQVEDQSEENNDESETEDDFPDKVKVVLKKERKITREAEARAVAAEKALKELKESKDNESEDKTSVVDDRFKNLYLASAAKTALVQAGLTKGTERFVKMLDLDSLEVDDDGSITGLEEQVTGLTTEFADLLIVEEEPKKRTVSKVDGAGRRETPQAPKTSAHQLIERLNK